MASRSINRGTTSSTMCRAGSLDNNTFEMYGLLDNKARRNHAKRASADLEQEQRRLDLIKADVQLQIQRLRGSRNSVRRHSNSHVNGNSSSGHSSSSNINSTSHRSSSSHSKKNSSSDSNGTAVPQLPRLTMQVSHSQPSLSLVTAVGRQAPNVSTAAAAAAAPQHPLHSIQEESPQVPRRSTVVTIPAISSAVSQYSPSRSSSTRLSSAQQPVTTTIQSSRPYPLTPQHYRSSGGALPPARQALPPISSDPRKRRTFNNPVPVYAHMLQQQSCSLTNGGPGSADTSTSVGMTDSGYSEQQAPSTSTAANTTVNGKPGVPSNVTQFDEQDLVYDESGQLLGGSLRALMKNFVPRRDYCPSKNFIFTFLLNARIFISPADLLHQMLQTCMFDQNADGDNFKKERRTRFFQNILKVTKEWSESFPYDFCDETMLRRLKELMSLCCAGDQQSQTHANSVIKCLNIRLAKLERYEKALADIQLQIRDQLQPSENMSGLLSVCDSAQSLAHQLTHVELERLSMIGANEYVEYFTKSSMYIENNAAEQNGITENGQTKETKKLTSTDNIMQYIDWSNRLTALVSSEITRNLRKRHRARVLDFFIDVAKECFNIGNFNSLMAIAAALDSSWISRLKKTWARASNANQWHVIKHQCDPSSNFSSYRCTLKAAVWRASQSPSTGMRVVVPFFTLELKDLTVRHSKCRRRLPNGHCNFAMFTQFADAVKQLQRWKQSDFGFDRHPATLQYLLTQPVFTEKALQLASYDCEAPDAMADRERHKKLKAEFQWNK